MWTRVFFFETSGKTGDTDKDIIAGMQKILKPFGNEQIVNLENNQTHLSND